MRELARLLTSDETGRPVALRVGLGHDSVLASQEDRLRVILVGLPCERVGK